MAYLAQKLKVTQDFSLIRGADDNTAGTVTALANTGKSYFNLGAATSLEGIVADTTGKVLFIGNSTGTAITVVNAAAGATAANRILTSSGKDVTVDSNSIMIFIYDDTATRWRFHAPLNNEAAIQGGNSLGTTFTLGTNDSQAVVLETNNTERIRVRVAASTDADVKISGTAGLEIPPGTTAQRPSNPVAGTIRLNTTTNQFEGYSNGAWQAIGGGVNGNPVRNYLVSYAEATVAPGTLSTVAANGNIVTTAGIFYADATSGAGALVQSSSTALRGDVNYLSVLSGASTAGATFFQFPAFSLDGEDLGKPLVISFDISSTLAANDYDVVVARYNSSGTFQELLACQGNASQSSSVPSAQLPTGTTSMQTFFLSGSTAGDLYAVRFRRLANAIQIRLDTLFAGPQQIMSAGAMTDWISYTPTGGWNTNVTFTGKYRQVGDTMQVICDVLCSGAPNASDCYFSIPAGFTIDTTKLPVASGSASPVLGSALAYDVGTRQYVCQAIYRSTTAIDVIQSESGNGGYINATNPFSFGASDRVSIFASFPIVNASSNTTTATRAVEEFASSSNGTWDAAAAAGNTVYGAVGSAISGTLTAARDKVVRFQTIIQPTDTLFLEYRKTGTNTWVAQADGIYPFLQFPGTAFGGLINSVSANDVTVSFQQYAIAGTTYNSNTGATNWNASVYDFWRLRKVSAGALVGFPMGARNVIGDTSGTTVPAGYLGEVINSSALAGISQNTPVSGTFYDDSGTLSLTPGRWLIFATISGGINGPTVGSAIQVPILYGAIRQGSSTLATAEITSAQTSTFSCYGSTGLSTPVSISSTTVYKVSIRWAPNSGAPTVTNIELAAAQSQLYAMRIG